MIGKTILIDEQCEDLINYMPAIGAAHPEPYWYIEIIDLKLLLRVRPQILIPFRYKGMPLQIAR